MLEIIVRVFLNKISLMVHISTFVFSKWHNWQRNCHILRSNVALTTNTILKNTYVDYVDHI